MYCNRGKSEILIKRTFSQKGNQKNERNCNNTTGTNRKYKMVKFGENWPRC